MIKIVTGKTEENHITSEDDRYKHAAIFGRYASILDVGEHLSPSIVSATTIRIASGDIMLGGTHGRIPFGSYEDVEIVSGTTGYNRMDAIVVAYKKFGGIESMAIEVVKGEPTTGTPVLDTDTLTSKYGLPPYDPGTGQYTQEFDSNQLPMYGDPMTGDKACAVICTVTLEGVNIKEITQRAKTHALADDKINLTNIFPTLYKISSQIVQVNNSLVSYSESANTKFSKIDEALLNLAQAIKTTQDKVKENSTNIAKNSEAIAKQNSAINSVIETMSTQIMHLDSSVQSLQSSVSSINTSLSTLDTSVADLGARVSALEAKNV